MIYRSDIDGLRAIAIVGVVLFHAGLPGFSGGFVGVDIFFVISGYLITSWIRERLVKGNFTFGQFYLGRLRRLAPSFFLMLLSVWIGGYFLVDEQGFANLGKALVSSLAFASNWFFLTQNGYFDSALETNPLLHTWSLSVEEQFYLLWPWVLFVLFRRGLPARGKLAAVLVPLFLLSLGTGIFLAYGRSSQQAFFNSGGRAWELLAGAAIALGMIGQVRSRRVVLLIRCVALLLLVVPIGFYSGKMAYPGAAAIVPVLGAFLFIVVSPGVEDPISRMLSSAPFRFVGQVSYSFYLWHWPLLVFAKMENPALPMAGRIAVVCAAFLLAGATTVLFEMPVRRREIWRGEKPFMFGASIAVAAFIAIGIAPVVQNGMPDRWEGVAVAQSNAPYDFGPDFDWGKCFIENHPLTNLTNSCLAPEAGKKNILVMGDSYAAHLMTGLRQNFPNYHFVQATASACKAMVNFWWGEFRCPELNRLLFSSTVKNPAYDEIILASDWGYGDRLDDTYAAIRAVTQTPVVVFGNTPVYTAPPKASLRKNALTGVATASKPPPFRERLWETNEDIRAHHGAAAFVSLLDNFCPHRECPLLTADGNYVHFDLGHVTRWGSIAVIAASRNEIAALLPK